MKLLIAVAFLIAVSASPLSNYPSNDGPVAPIENISLAELSKENERKQTSEIILEAIIASLDKIQDELVEENSQKINEGIRNILNTIQNILKNRGKEEVDREFKDIGHTKDKIRADPMLDSAQQNKDDSNEYLQDSAPNPENNDNENTVLNNKNQNDKVLDSEQIEEDPSKVKFIDMLPQKNENNEAQSSKDAKNDQQIEDNFELLRTQNLRQPEEIQYIPPWLNRPVPY